MKVFKKTMFSLFVVGGLTLVQSCENESVQYNEVNIPEGISKTEWRKQEFKMDPPQKLANPGKIYVAGNTLIITEVDKGIHIYDNSNPSDPKNIGFFDMYLNSDVAVKDNFLYANNYSDIMVINISNAYSPTLENRVEDAIAVDPMRISEGFSYGMPYNASDINSIVVTSWEQEVIETTCKGDDCSNELVYSWGEPQMGEDMGMFRSAENAGSTSSSGKGGSMSGYTIYGDYLYMINEGNIIIYNVSNPSEPVYKGINYTHLDLQTILAQDGKLFLGTATGMQIYSINGGGDISELSFFTHVTSCDPVAVQGDRAYVTLSGGCFNPVNELNVIDISNPADPRLIATQEFGHPQGLAVKGDHLYLCDDEDGFKIFDKKRDDAIRNNMIHDYWFVKSYDIILNGDFIILIGEDGILQYDASDINNIKKLGGIFSVN